jgi:hypothetical protein
MDVFKLRFEQNNPSFENIERKHAKKPIWRGSGIGPIPVLLGHVLEIPAVLVVIVILSLTTNFHPSKCRNVAKIGNRWTDGRRNDFNEALFFTLSKNSKNLTKISKIYIHLN